MRLPITIANIVVFFISSNIVDISIRVLRGCLPLSFIADVIVDSCDSGSDVVAVVVLVLWKLKFHCRLLVHNHLRIDRALCGLSAC
jgi:hypothetical protein